MELADRATATPHDVPDRFFDRLRHHYSDEALVELGAIIALENYRSRFNRIFRIESQGFYCVVPQRG